MANSGMEATEKDWITALNHLTIVFKIVFKDRWALDGARCVIEPLANMPNASSQQRQPFRGV